MAKKRLYTKQAIATAIVVIIIAVLALGFLFRVGLKLYDQHYGEKSATSARTSIPASVRSKYEEGRKTSFRSMIEACTNKDEKIYVVTASYESALYDYFDGSGTYIGQYVVSDVAGQSSEKPPVDITQYDCRVEIKS